MSRSGFLALFDLPSPAHVLVTMGRAVLVWQDRIRMRTDLSRLDAHLLRDIGVDATRAVQEAQKPFWRA